MTDQQQPAAATPGPEQRVAEIADAHAGCVASGDDLCPVPWLLDRLAAVEQERDAIAEHAVDTLMGSCTADDHHGVDRMSFAAFLETEGVRCSLCVAAERDALRAELEGSKQRVAAITCQEDLDGMLPEEIVAVVKRLTHQLRQERERRESVERRHANLVKHTQYEYGSRQRLERQLDALLRVWCSGSCGTGVLRWITPDRYPNWRERRTEVTEEIVAFAEENTKRLRTWFENNERKPLAASTPRTEPGQERHG